MALILKHRGEQPRKRYVFRKGVLTKDVDKALDDALPKRVPFSFGLKQKGFDYKKIGELLPYMTREEKKTLDELIAPRTGEIDWMPLPGPQTAAFHSKANLLLYGGAAGGGKTDLLLGISYYKHHRSALFRREYASLTAIMDRAQDLFGVQNENGENVYGGYNGFFRRWNFYDRPGHLLEYGAADKIGTERKKQGQAHDAKLFDEGPQFTFGQFNYLRGWNRRTSMTPIGQLLQTVVTCNPPQSVEERWINTVWAPWLDKARFPEGARPGQLIYFITHDGQYIKVDGPGRHVYKNKERLALSHTFIPSSLKDNPYLDDGQYESVLESLPEPLRSMLLFGDFAAGISDDPWQLIPTAWIEEAAERWNSLYGGKPPTGMNMSQLGVDVARGGAAKTVLTPRWGPFFGKQKEFKGLQTKDGMKVAGLVVQEVQPLTLVVIDAIGVGASPLDWLRGQVVKGVQMRVVGWISSQGTEETDKTGYLRFKNKRALMGWRFREALDPNVPGGNKTAIPPDPELMADLAAYKFKVSAGGIALEDKDVMSEELGRSPDKGDSIFLAGLPAHPINFEQLNEGLGSAVMSEYGRPTEEFGSVAESSDAPWNIHA